MPSNETPESVEATPQRKAASLFGVDPDRHCAGQDKDSAKKGERSARREKIEATLGISLGEKTISEKKANNVKRAFGLSNQCAGDRNEKS